MGRSEREALEQMTLERNLAVAQCKDAVRQFNEELDKVLELTVKMDVIVEENNDLRKRLEIAVKLLKNGGQLAEVG